jgi:hypothetical protein
MPLGVRARINSHFGASPGRADARRRDAGDVVTSSRSGNAADLRRPPRFEGLQPLHNLNSYVLLSADFLFEKAAAKWEVIFARALSRHQSLKLSYSKGAYVRFGGNFHGLSVAWQYSWLGRLN